MTENILETVSRSPGYYRFEQKDAFQYLADDSLVFKLKIPEIKTRYETPVWQNVQQIWIRFLSVFVIVYIAMNKLKDIAFARYWIRAWEVVPWKKTL